MESKAALWTGRIISALIVLFMLFDGVAKVVRFAPYVKGTTEAGFADHLVVPLGVLGLVCTILYAIPRTSILGGILLTAYYGGATATHVRLGQPFWIAVIFGILVWIALYLRDIRLRALVPLRSNANQTASRNPS